MSNDAEEEPEEEQGEEQPPAKRARRDGGEVNFGFKALCPDTLTAAMIGSAGATRNQIQEECDATIRMSARDEFFPNTSCRIVTITADEQSKVVAVLEKLMEKLIDCAAKDLEKGKGKGDADTLFGRESGEYVFRLSLPRACTGGLIGHSGSRIQRMREELGAKVFIENETHAESQMVRIIGEQDAIMNALQQVCDIIQEEMTGDRLAHWLATPSVEGRDEKGKGKGKKGKDKDGRERRRGGGGSGSWDRQWDDADGGGGGRWDRQWDDAHGDHQEALGSQGSEASLEAIRMLMREFPQGKLDLQHSVECQLPNERVGGLIGRKGEAIQEVEKATGARVNFEQPLPDDPNRTVTIVGPLISVYAAHMMLMKRYHEDVEREEEERRERERKREQESEVARIQSQLEDLKRQLAVVEGGGGANGRSRKGGGKGKK